VDWLRSCYESEWHLFADSPATKTGGRYYISPPKNPFVGTTHFYASRRWHETNYTKIQSLGEDLESQQAWFNGEPPAVKPNAIQVGSNTCFNFGDAIANALGDDDMREGFIGACFTPAVPLDPLWEMASTYDSCALQFFYATLLKWAGDGLHERMTTAFHMLLGDAAQTFFVVTLPPRPNVMICKMPTFSVVVVDGTPNPQTLAMQAFASIIRPQNVGLYGTYAPWYALSSFVNDLCNTVGVNANAPVFLVGYSMGGAMIDNVAARWYNANPQRKIRTLTFGAPKPGNSRLIQFLKKLPGISIANEQDIVCSLPPTLNLIFPVATALLMPSLYAWAEWEQEPNRARQANNGVLTFNVNPIIDTPLLTHLVTQIIGVQPFDPVLPHRIKEYRRRIEVRCPQTQWPISQVLWDYLHGADNPDIDVGVGVGVEVLDLNLCPCCATEPSPETFDVILDVPEVPELDGQIMTMIQFISGPAGCGWIGMIIVEGEELTLEFFSELVDEEVLFGGSLGFTGSEPFMFNAGFGEADDFSCLPWGFVVSAPLFDGGDPLGFDITVRTLPLLDEFFNVGVALGVEVVDG